jgi:hypothetical protein
LPSTVVGQVLFRGLRRFAAIRAGVVMYVRYTRYT